MSRKILVGLYGLTVREVNRFLRIWPQTFVPSLITSVLYFLIFGQVIGQRIGSMAGMNYMLFIVPGLIMMAVINSAYSNVVSSVYISRYSRFIEEILVSPLPSWSIIIGYASGGILRGVLIGFLVAMVSLIFVRFDIAHPLFALFSLLLCSTLFSFAGFINGILARRFDDTSIVTTFLLTPLIYLGGVFYSIKALPLFWQRVSLFNPIHYIIDLFRYALLGVSTTPISLSLSAVVGFTLLLFLIAWYCLYKGIGVRA
ncbi:ABC transporter permease [Piscirickettsia litoralis]|uniref:Transport permease protein n=1 Tax=Piscirickettsia litoralis TaxID=1891921 RepID=A0ABX3A0B0_9GAMM|nr:ABC transporter permease [Piscirickettsia litoralis]ODN42223.1 ABC transporter permease [Piscirickettsia litoralis]